MDLQIKQESSMPVIFSKDSTWEVVVGRDRFLITGNQASVLKKATEQGIKMIWFEKVAISIPHITSISLISTAKEKHPIKEYSEISVEQRERNIERLKDIRSQILGI